MLFSFFVLFLYCINLQASRYVGKELCKKCHAEQVGLWQGSHHDLAMQHVNDETVLGDFSSAIFGYAGISSKFYKQKNKFMVRTDGADGKLHDYEIKYTFGVTPLQQYLVELENGRLQVLSIAWDSREVSQGGQRWFHLYPDEKITYTDELHWTRPSFNWNGMCAECHSTNLQKNYDSKNDTFLTSWTDIDVSCEACHGPASNHVRWAEELVNPELGVLDKYSGFGFSFDERKNISWVIDDKSGTAQRSHKRETEKEIEVCAQCHSRRSAVTDNYQPGESFYDHYMPRLLDEGMYFSDGQIQDEVYVYGSFLQSKMYHKGVTCSDCHEPHSLQLRQVGNGVCLQCHDAKKFDSKKHHFHKIGSTGTLCAECHMPPRTYMLVDPRHDHSIRIPRPDLSVKLGTPNACTQCHEDKDSLWAALQLKQWYGNKSAGYQQFAEALNSGRAGKSNAGELLASIIRNEKTPDIVRASAASIITSYLDQSNIDVLYKGLKDKDAKVRLASVSALVALPQAMLAQLAFPLIDDPVRSVRIEAARVLAPVFVGQLHDEHLEAYNRAMNEYIYSQLINAEIPQAQLNLGNYYSAKGGIDKAIIAYKKAIMLEDVFIPAYINLAELYRTQKNYVDEENMLRKAVKISPENADAYYAFGLLLIRQKKNKEAVEALQRAANSDLMNAHYIYVYAVALNSTGKKEQAINVLQEANIRFPEDLNIIEALIVFHHEMGNEFSSRVFLRKSRKLK